MVSKIENKIAIVINGDEELRHQDNVNQSVRELKAQGYTVYLASTQKNEQADVFVRATGDAIQTMIQDVRDEINENTDLVIYTTGHGDLEKDGENNLCLESECETDAFTQLDSLQNYARRTVIMDQCFGANSASRFVDDARSLFISTGNQDKAVSCQEWTPKFWQRAEQIDDLNEDGVISWQERFANAFDDISSLPTFLMSEEYLLEGEAPFAAKVHQNPQSMRTEQRKPEDVFAERAWIDDQLANLRPGQIALVYFSADWCGPCRAYDQHFQQLAKQAQGQVLFLKTNSPEVAEEFGENTYPAVILRGHGGRQWKIKDSGNPWAEMRNLQLDPSQKLAGYRQAIDSEDERVSSRAQNAYLEILQAIKITKGQMPPVLAKEISAIQESLAIQQGDPQILTLYPGMESDLIPKVHRQSQKKSYHQRANFYRAWMALIQTQRNLASYSSLLDEFWSHYGYEPREVQLTIIAETLKAHVEREDFGFNLPWEGSLQMRDQIFSELDNHLKMLTIGYLRRKTADGRDEVYNLDRKELLRSEVVFLEAVTHLPPECPQAPETCCDCIYSKKGRKSCGRD